MGRCPVFGLLLPKASDLIFLRLSLPRHAWSRRRCWPWAGWSRGTQGPTVVVAIYRPPGQARICADCIVVPRKPGGAAFGARLAGAAKNFPTQASPAPCWQLLYDGAMARIPL